jgi:polyisoprenoid-binding protein YceI
MSVTTTAQTPLAAGTWVIDLAHSEVSFSVRHLMVSKVRGSFTRFDGAITIAADPLQSTVAANIDLTSIDTRDAKRDEHLRSDDFFSTANFPSMSYRSTAVRADGDDFAVDGELTLHGVTQPVTLALEYNGSSPDPWGGTRAGFSAKTEINRRDFGVDLTMPLETGGVVVGDKISVYLEVEAILQP